MIIEYPPVSWQCFFFLLCSTAHPAEKLIYTIYTLHKKEMIIGNTK